MDGAKHGIARWLLPPTERSGALTSLRNPLVDPWRPLAQCLCLLPKAVVRQARRNTTTPTFLLESFIVCYAFTAGAFWSNPPSLINDPWGLLRMAIPASAASLGLLLRNAYSAPQESPSPLPALIDGIVATVLAFLSQQVLTEFAPGLLLPHWAPTQGGVWGLEFLVVVRHLLPPAGRRSEDSSQPNTLEELPWQLEAFGETIAWVRKGHSILAVLLIVASAFFVCTARFISARAGAALILLGALLLFGHISHAQHQRGIADGSSTDGIVAIYRHELKLQRALLQWIRWWYCVSLIPGIILVLFGSRVYAYLILLPVSLALTAVHLEAARCSQEVSELEATEG